MSGTTEERLARVEEALTGVNREIRDIKVRLDRSDEILKVIYRLTEQNDHILAEIKEHDGRLRAIEERPKKHWDAVIGTVIGALAGAFAAWILGRGGL